MDHDTFNKMHMNIINGFLASSFKIMFYIEKYSLYYPRSYSLGSNCTQGILVRQIAFAVPNAAFSKVSTASWPVAKQAWKFAYWLLTKWRTHCRSGETPHRAHRRIILGFESRRAIFRFDDDALFAWYAPPPTRSGSDGRVDERDFVDELTISN